MKKLLLSSLLLTQSLFCNEEKPQYRYSGKAAVDHLKETGECYQCDLSKQNLIEALTAARIKNPGKKINLTHSKLYYAELTTEGKKDLLLTGANAQKISLYRYAGDQAIEHLAKTGECHDCLFFGINLMETLSTVRENHPGKKINLINADLQYAYITTEDRDDLLLTGAITDTMRSYRFANEQAVKHLQETGECHDCWIVAQDLTPAIAAFKKSNPNTPINLERTTLYRAYFNKTDLTDRDLTGAEDLKHAYIDNTKTTNI